MPELIIVIVWGVVWGAIATAVSAHKGEEGGFWWGFFLGFIGVIIVACQSNNNFQSIDYRSSPLMNSNSSSNIPKGSSIPIGEGWECKNCGRVNPNYTGTCGCGTSKNHNVKVERKIEERKDDEMKNIEKIKSYKELLDSGIITQEEFDRKKSELLRL